MNREERAALAAIIASGLVGKLDCSFPACQQAVATQALAVADIILNQTHADDKTAYEREKRT